MSFQEDDFDCNLAFGIPDSQKVVAAMKIFILQHNIVSCQCTLSSVSSLTH